MNDVTRLKWTPFRRALVSFSLIRTPIYVVTYIILFGVYPANHKGAWDGDQILNYFGAFAICVILNILGAIANFLFSNLKRSKVPDTIKRHIIVESILPILSALVTFFNSNFSETIPYLGFSVLLVTLNTSLIWIWRKRSRAISSPPPPAPN